VRFVTKSVPHGEGDAVSFGVTSYIRQGLGYDSVVDYSGGAYTVGQVGGMINSFLIGYKAAGAAPDAYRAYLAWRAGQGYTAAGTVYGVGHSSYVLATDPQNFGFTDALGFLPLGGYVTSRGLTAARMWWNRPFVERMSPAEAARYRRYWEQQYHQQGHGTRFRDQAPPGTRSIVDQKLSRETGEVYRRETIYDQYGRRIGNNDYTNHGRPDHANPHHHTRDPITGRRGDDTPGLHPQTPPGY
jgi:hypothetical protein